MGVVELVADPADGRAKRVRFTRRGLEAIHHGTRRPARHRGRAGTRIGARPMAALRSSLAALAPALEALSRAEAALPAPPAR